MKRTACLAFAFLLCSVASPSQITSVSHNQLNFIVPVPLSSACPVGMRARHEDGLHSRINVNGPTPKEIPGLHLTLTLTDRRPSPITGATVTVRGLTYHGMNGQLQKLQAGAAHDGSADATKTLDLVFAADKKEIASANLVAPGFTSVSSIELDSVSYADGSTWKTAPQLACKIAPDPFMLVDAQMAH